MCEAVSACRVLAQPEITALLDRGWRRAPQHPASKDGGDIRISIRQIVWGDDEE